MRACGNLVFAALVVWLLLVAASGRVGSDDLPRTERLINEALQR